MRVLVTGCFDILHPGHLFLFREAAKLGEVVVIVARDSTIKKWKKISPIVPEDQRLEVIQALRDVSYATLGNDNKNFMEKALSLKPDLILLGPNQKISTDQLKQELKRHHAEHIQVRRLETLYDKYKLNSSSAIKEKIRTISQTKSNDSK